jgi:hypothetical protein
MFDKKTQRLIDKELRIPCHLNHIADRVFKLPRVETQSIIQNMLEYGILVESKFAKNYYLLKEYV